MKVIVFFKKHFRVYEIHKPKTAEEMALEILFDCLDRKRSPLSINTLVKARSGQHETVGRRLYHWTDCASESENSVLELDATTGHKTKRGRR